MAIGWRTKTVRGIRSVGGKLLRAIDPAPAPKAPKKKPTAIQPLQKVAAKERLNARYSTYHKTKALTVPVKPIFGPDDRIFTIGSCFAERIRTYLSDQGMRVGPPMADVRMSPTRYRVDRLPKREHMDYFNSFTIRQEFERFNGEWAQEPDDYWTLPRDPFWDGIEIYQDPYRRAIYGRTPEDLQLAVSRVNEAIDKGINEATVFFMTLGMAEVFINKKSGKVACQKPGYAGGGGENESEFYMSTFADNLANMNKVVEIINKTKPGAQIVVTVSPVPLAITFGGGDIVVANTRGKSILRAVLDELERTHDNVTYFPAYEIVMGNSPFSFVAEDGRHVENATVGRIVTAFKKAHYFDPEAVTDEEEVETVEPEAETAEPIKDAAE